MLPLRCSRLRDWISRDSSWPSSTIPTGLSSAGVTLINMVFDIQPSPPRGGAERHQKHRARIDGRQIGEHGVDLVHVAGGGDDELQLAPVGREQARGRGGV